MVIATPEFDAVDLRTGLFVHVEVDERALNGLSPEARQRIAVPVVQPLGELQVV